MLVHLDDPVPDIDHDQSDQLSHKEYIHISGPGKGSTDPRQQASDRDEHIAFETRWPV